MLQPHIQPKILYALTPLLVLLARFAKLPKMPMSLFMYVCPSVRVEQLGCQLTSVRKISYRGIFVEICRKNLGFIKTGHKHQELHVKTRVSLWLLLILSLPRYGIPLPPPGGAALSGPGSPRYRNFTITLRHVTLGRTPLDEGSFRRRDY